jgi:hypothetical protein
VPAKRRRLRWAAPIAAVVSFASVPALADVTKEQCLDANGKAQDLRRAGKLSAAREQLRTCANQACPLLVRDDCTKRLDDLERAQPAIVFDAKDGAGRDVSLVKVTVDGQPLADKLDGTPLQIDPGEHVFVFTVPEHPAVTQTFVLKEGDRERRERIVLGPAVLVGTAAGAAPLSTTPTGGESGSGMGTQKMVGLVAGGVGVAGVAVGSVFGLMTLSQASQQQTDCASSTKCANPSQAASDHSNATTDRTLSTVGFIAGGALLVGGAVLFFTARPSSEAPAATGMLLLPNVGPGGGGVSLSGEF